MGNLRPPAFKSAGELLSDVLLAFLVVPSASAAGWECTSESNLFLVVNLNPGPLVSMTTSVVSALSPAKRIPDGFSVSAITSIKNF